MRTIKIFAILFFTVICVKGFGQMFQNVITVTITDYDYTVLDPAFGKVSGTYEYHFMYRLSKDGYLESIHWNGRNFNLRNDAGEKIIVIDSGHDNLGVLWPWFNTPNAINDAIQPGIHYSVEDGWLDEYMPDPMPSEGVAVEMSCKIKLKGLIFKMPFLAIFHINANGVYTVEMIKP